MNLKALVAGGRSFKRIQSIGDKLMEFRLNVVERVSYELYGVCVFNCENGK
jgi:hypothetical protein